MKHLWKQQAKCSSCKGTGVYKGIGEKGKVGVVCCNCKGTGQIELKVEWEDFEERIIRDNIKRVVEVNPGMFISENPEFGGMPYEDWLKGKPFPLKSENRKYICPCWWYQSANYDLKPDWKECRGNCGISFSSCSHFKNKHLCWERWDREGKNEPN